MPTKTTISALAVASGISDSDLMALVHPYNASITSRVTVGSIISRTSSSLGLGTAATLNYGTSAGNAVQLNSIGGLPAVSGYNLTSIGLTPYGITTPTTSLVSGDAGKIITVQGVTTAEPNTVALLHFNGTNGSTTFTDSAAAGTAPHTFTPNGAAQISTTTPVFGTGCGSFNGSNSYLVSETKNDFKFGTGEFNIEFRVKFNSLAALQVICGTADAFNGSGGWYIGANGTNLIFKAAYNGAWGIEKSEAWVPSTGTWYAVCVRRIAGVLTFFVNGTAVGSDTGFTTTTEGAGTIHSNLYIGKSYDASNYWFNGYLDEFRASNTGRYGASYTPAVAEFSGSTLTGLKYDLTAESTSSIVTGPATTTSGKVPVWDGGTNILLDGLTVGTTSSCLVQLNASAQLPAVSGALLTSIPAAAGAVTAISSTPLNMVPTWGVGTNTLNPGLSVGTAALNLLQLNASAQIPAVDGSLLTGFTDQRVIDIDGGGGVLIVAGTLQKYWRAQCNFNITGWYLYAYVSGSIEIDLWNTNDAGYPATISNTMPGASHHIILSGATKASGTVSGWTSVAVTAGDVMLVNVVSASLVQHVSLFLTYART